MQSPGRYAASYPCGHADSYSFDSRACRTESGFLGVHGSELQFRSELQFCPKCFCAHGVWRTQRTDSRCSECACLLKALGDDAASGQHTADDGGKRQARHPSSG